MKWPIGPKLSARRPSCIASTGPQNSIGGVGKESDGWEEDEARTAGQDTVLIYPSSSFDRERMVELIKSVGQRELMREARTAMRSIDAVHEGQNIADRDLKRIAAAVERIELRMRKLQNEHVATVAWLKAERDKIGLTALAKLVGIDAANLSRVIDGKRKPSASMIWQVGGYDDL
jgi:hypothetical protein